MYVRPRVVHKPALSIADPYFTWLNTVCENNFTVKPPHIFQRRIRSQTTVYFYGGVQQYGFFDDERSGRKSCTRTEITFVSLNQLVKKRNLKTYVFYAAVQEFKQTLIHFCREAYTCVCI